MDDRVIMYQLFVLAPRKMNEIIIVLGTPHIIYVTATLHRAYTRLLQRFGRQYGRPDTDIPEDHLTIMKTLRHQPH